MLAAERSPVVTIGQFRVMAKERGWSEAWLVEQCKDRMYNPRAIIREMPDGSGMTKPQVTGDDQPASRVSLTDTVLAWWPLLNLYQARHSPCACGRQKPLQGKQRYASPARRQRVSSVKAPGRPHPSNHAA